jgi:hypothetical protein
MNLSRRSTQSERMDTDCVDFDDYSRCLRDLSGVNLITMTHRPTLSWVARRATGNFSVLDAPAAAAMRFGKSAGDFQTQSGRSYGHKL